MQDKTRSHGVYHSVSVSCKAYLFCDVNYANIHQPNKLEVHDRIYDICVGEMEAQHAQMCSMHCQDKATGTDKKSAQLYR